MTDTDGGGQTTLCHVACPYCDDAIPVGVNTYADHGNLRIEPNPTDVWAHAWTHGLDEPA